VLEDMTCPTQIGKRVQEQSRPTSDSRQEGADAVIRTHDSRQERSTHGMVRVPRAARLMRAFRAVRGTAEAVTAGVLGRPRVACAGRARSSCLTASQDSCPRAGRSA
jgi:hypothetical protein